MTREDAIKLLVNATYSDEFQGDEELTTAHLMAINALEQEPCEDCISRQALISAFPISDTYTLDDIIASIKFQPPVTPTRKKGKWIDGHCSECGCDVPAYIDDWKWIKDMDAKFCPKCGIEMEVEE